MAVSVIAVCRQPEKLGKASEHLSIVVTAGAFIQSAAKDVDVVLTSVPEEQMHEAERAKQGSSEHVELQNCQGCDAGSVCTFSVEVSEGAAASLAAEARAPAGASCSGAPSSKPPLGFVSAGVALAPNSAAVSAAAQEDLDVKPRSERGAAQRAAPASTSSAPPASAAPASSSASFSCSLACPSSLLAGASSSASSSSNGANAAKPDISVLASAVAAAKLGLVDQLSQAVTTCAAVAFAKDAEDRTCLHYAAGYGHEECVSLLLEHQSDARVRDANGDVPLHFAAIHGHPMCAYNITKACPATCLTRNYRGQTPVEVAVACERGEVLNAMLLACAGDGSAGVAVQAMRKLLASGAVPDTWAPNGSSALMLAAAANGTEALAVLLEAGATLELQDALGRSALMFAAGNCAKDTLVSLLDAGACISQRDRRGRNVLDYAPSGSEVRRLLQARLDELEAVANKLQQDLLASLGSLEVPAAGAGTAGGAEAKGPSGGKKKKQQQQQASKKGGAGAANGPAKSGGSGAAGGGGSGTGSGAAAPAAAAAANSGAAVRAKVSAQPSTVPSAWAPSNAAALSDRRPVSGAAPSSSAVLPVDVTAPGAAAAEAAAAVGRGPRAKGARAGKAHMDPSSDDGDDSEWQMVSSSKCGTKTRQQQQQHPTTQDSDTHRSGSSTGSSVAHTPSSSSHPAAPSGSSAAGGCARPGHNNSGRGAPGGAATSSSSVAAAAAGAAASSLGRPGLTSGKPATSQSGGRAQGPQSGSAVGPATASTAGASGATAKPMASHGKGRAPSMVAEARGPTHGSRPAAGSPAGPGGGGSGSSTAVPRKGAPGGQVQASTATGLAAAPAAVAAAPAGTVAPANPLPVCGFKAALLGLDASACPSVEAASTPAAVASGAGSGGSCVDSSAVHLDLHPIAVVASARTLTPPPRPPTAPAAPAPAATAAERKPAWGGVKPGAAAPSAGSATSAPCVAGCSPRSYPPLSASSGGASSVSAASQPPKAPSHPAKSSQTGAAPATRGQVPSQQPQPQLLSLLPLSPTAPPPTPAAPGAVAAPSSATFLASATGAAALSCCGESSFCTAAAAACSVPPSVASLAESESFASTGHSTCGSQPGAGESSPLSFGHDWTRPSPVDVLLQAAIAAAGDAASSSGRPGSSNSGEGRRPCHSKTNSAGSSSCLSFECGAGGVSALDATLPAAAPQAQQSSPVGISQLGGTEVPPPVRRSKEVTGLSQMEGVLTGRTALPTSGAMSLGSPPRCCGEQPTAVAAAAGEWAGRASGGGAAAAAGGAAVGRNGRKAAAGRVAAGGGVSDIARLKAENEALQRRLRQAEQRHSEELAAVIMDAEEHEATVVERAIAEERLRITANLLAIGLCPEAILAVITPPGHGMDVQSLLAGMDIGSAAAAAATAAAAAATAAAVPQQPHSQMVTLPATLDSPVAPVAGKASLGGPRAAAGPAGGATSCAIASAASAVASSTNVAAAAASRSRSSGSGCGYGSASVAAAAACGGSGAPMAAGPRSHHSSCDSACALSCSGGRCWEDGTSCSSGDSSRAATTTGSTAAAAATATSAAGAGDYGSHRAVNASAAAAGRGCALPPLAAARAPSAAIAIPGGAAMGAAGTCSFSASATCMRPQSYSSHLHGFGSPGACGGHPGFGGCGSFGSGGMVGSLCGGLGLGLLSGVGLGEACSGGVCGTLAVAAEEGEGEGEEADEMDLPACGDISALLAMSDDDDA